MITYGNYVLAIEKTDRNYEELKEKIRNRPQNPTGYTYKLRADTLEWELVELPLIPEPDPTAEELLDIILGGAT